MNAGADIERAGEVLRRIIEAIAPEAVERIEEGLGAFEQDGEAGLQRWLAEQPAVSPSA